MTVTIDRAGRLVVPKPIRERYHMHPGVELELEDDGRGIHLRIPEAEGGLVRDERGMLIFQGSKDASEIDIAEFINAQRNERSGEIMGETESK